METEAVTAADVKKRVTLRECFRLNVLAGFIEEIHFQFSADDQQEFLSRLNPRAVLDQVRVGRDPVPGWMLHQTHLQRPVGLGDEIRAGPEIIRGQHECKYCVLVANAFHVAFTFLR